MADPLMFAQELERYPTLHVFKAGLPEDYSPHITKILQELGVRTMDRDQQLMHIITKLQNYHEFVISVKLDNSGVTSTPGRNAHSSSAGHHTPSPPQAQETGKSPFPTGRTGGGAHAHATFPSTMHPRGNPRPAPPPSAGNSYQQRPPGSTGAPAGPASTSRPTGAPSVAGCMYGNAETTLCQAVQDSAAHDLGETPSPSFPRMNNDEKANQVKRILRNDKKQAFIKRTRMEQRETEFLAQSNLAKKMYQENVPKEQQDLLLLHNPAGLVKWMNGHLKSLRSHNRGAVDPPVRAPSEHVALRGTDDPPLRGHQAAAERGAGGSSNKGRRTRPPVKNNRAGEEDQPYIKERGSIADLLSPAPAGSSGLNLWEHGRPSKILWNTSDQTGYEKAINESTPLSEEVTHEDFFWNEWEEKKECVLSTLPASQAHALIKQVKRWVARYTAAVEQDSGVSRPLTIAGGSTTPMKE
ncbi:hypothetical protein CEUSTIGMA_g13356.t1 [Chlamydomonas eustigma]|uniref:Uncharacterized protein n=1 Tax=Chlamydomonas eustigma TaxID=1157962 RepID=A0A250XT11_9CHLO|nr:hypothetical protein CEUSTIGMA_g13356.t1 [Chlamydomonas eustigma]|eukprot:GAX85940.1 hypothetical protein CEUSTIGMA_g13356.t1 [Chlamydomonas eustigma]